MRAAPTAHLTRRPTEKKKRQFNRQQIQFFFGVVFQFFDITPPLDGHTALLGWPEGLINISVDLELVGIQSYISIVITEMAEHYPDT